MSGHSHRATMARVDRLFTSEISSRKRLSLFSELDRCDTCAKRYCRYHAMESALTSSSEPLNSFARERVLRAVLDDVSRTRSSFGLNFARNLAAAAAVGLAALLVFVAIRPTHAPRPHRVSIPNGAVLSPVREIQSKGQPADGDSDIGIRVFKVAAKGSIASEASTLEENGIITFTYTYAKPRKGYLALFGLQETGEVRWYYPGYGDEKSVPISGDRVDEPLGDGIDLSVNHEPGWLRITAVFSERPIAVKAIEKSVDSLRRGGDPSAIASLPDADWGAKAAQHSIMVDISGNE